MAPSFMQCNGTAGCDGCSSHPASSICMTWIRWRTKKIQNVSAVHPPSRLEYKSCSRRNWQVEADRHACARALSNLCAAQIQRPAAHVKHDSVFTMGLGEAMDVTVTAAIASLHLGTRRMQSTRGLCRSSAGIRRMSHTSTLQQKAVQLEVRTCPDALEGSRRGPRAMR